MKKRYTSSLISKSRCSSIAVLTTLAIGFPSAYASSPSELKGVKSEISRQQSSLSSQQKKLNSLQDSLRKQEVGISSLETQIKKTKSDLATTNANIDTLHNNIQQLEQQKNTQTERLEELIKTYYVTQRAKASSNILNNGVEEDRISQYFQHLAKERAAVIEELEKTHQQLADNERQLALEKEQITQLLNEQTRKRDSLAKTQNQRKKTLGQIKKSISNDQVYLSELQRNETRLKAEIAKAAKRNAVPMNGLGSKQGKLPWPLKGKVIHSYGTRQTGQVDWSGIVIDADYGQAVKSVYSGTVVFAEYLRGYGLVVLLDHGKGDMTLYGFNQTLLKKEGDKVTAGETIALAGDTGGQSRPSLYFEIRRNSKTQNPKRWLTR
ncbi:murein hydrolase activator EnvC family protein [Vibrio paucivorans]|uniref:Murein hydrolase activator EnvC n=1 Tax=Vibrio paucivorans TaxID=2829489 RepID=A0A9X3CEW4_9VIBR|nr:murein hydrolase activator EnvC [Vibrio paucivorans]MCW8334476.1 murein hydrolase activator EnvC [Vibrio paucivorans]